MTRVILTDENGVPLPTQKDRKERIDRRELDIKACFCGKAIQRKRKENDEMWAKHTYCSKLCADAGRRGKEGSGERSKA